MANGIKLGNSFLSDLKLGTSQIIKVMLGSTAVWRKTYSGSFYTMTSDSTPAGFTANWFNNGGYSFGGSPYQAFDNNNGTYCYGEATQSGHWVGAQLDFTQAINVRQMSVRLGSAGGGRSNAGQVSIDLKINGSWTNVISSGSIGAGGEYEAYNFSISYDNVTGVRGRFIYGSGDTSALFYIYHMQVNQWQLF